VSELGDTMQRFWDEIAARPDGPLALRFYLQPFTASLLALRDGIKDARGGRRPYFWKILHDPEQRAASLKVGLKATAKVLALGIVMDMVYQYLVIGSPKPFEAIFIALLLGFVPYLLLRGPVDRVARWWMRRGAEGRR
jgi:hypothetical protein